MEKEEQNNHSRLFSWFDDPSEPQSNRNFQINQNFTCPNIDNMLVGYIESTDSNPGNEMEPQPKLSPESTTVGVLVRTSSSENAVQQFALKDEKEQHENPRHQPKDPKDQKQHIYSKAYRERKKQRYKTLEDENEFLKKRIKELQYKLRQQQIELNRFKFPPPEKELTLQEFRRQFLQRTVLVLNQHKSNPMQETKQVYTPKDPFYHEFLDIYAERGFAGSRKLKLLNYHFNQIFQALLKDSERYLVLMFSKSKSWEDLQPLPEYESLHTAFYNVFQLDEDLKGRLKYFVKNLYPLHLELTKHCSTFYKGFQSILECSQKIHNFIQETYLSNMDVARKRIELQTWFQFHKYSKSMRKLRFQWLELVKEGCSENQDEIKKNSRGTKRKKTVKEDQ